MSELNLVSPWAVAFLLLQLAMAAGFTAVLVWSQPYRALLHRLAGAALRRWSPQRVLWAYQLLSCPVCLGFWVGTAWGALGGLGWASVGLGGLTALLAKRWYAYLET